MKATKPLSWNDLHPDIPFDYGLTSLEHAYSHGQWTDIGEVDLAHVALGLYLINSQFTETLVDSQMHTRVVPVLSLGPDFFPAINHFVQNSPFLKGKVPDLQAFNTLLSKHRGFDGPVKGTFQCLDALWVSLARQRGLEGFRLLEATSVGSIDPTSFPDTVHSHNMVLVRDFCTGLDGWDALDALGQNILKLILLYYLKGGKYYSSFKDALLRIERLRMAFSMEKKGVLPYPVKCLAALLPTFGIELMEDWYDLKVSLINPDWTNTR